MKWLKNLVTGGLHKKAIIAIFVLAAVDMFSMTAPYYLKYVIPHLNTYLGVTQDQFDAVTAALGWVVLATQIPSGWLADKLSGRRLLIVSVIMSGIFTILFGLASQKAFGTGTFSLTMLYIIFCGFGVSTTLFLWAPLWKVLSQQGTQKEQGKVYGLQGSYNGLLGLLVVTLIGTIATELAKNGNNVAFYIMVYVIAAALFLSAFGTWKFIEETQEKSVLLIKVKEWFNRSKNTMKKHSAGKGIKEILKPMLSIRVWLLSISLLGMYMFQSIFAYYLKDFMVIAVPAVAVTAIAGFRTYGLRLITSAPFGRWLQKRKSWILTLSIILAIGILGAVAGILIGGFGNNITNTTSTAYITALSVLLPIIVIFVGTISWFLVAGRYMQIDEIPSTKSTYGSIVALVSFIAFSSDAWFYQMASSWMKSSGHVMDAKAVARLGYGTVGSYDQAGLQQLLFVALGLGCLGVLAGLTIFYINHKEIKKLNKSSYRWRRHDVKA